MDKEFEKDLKLFCLWIITLVVLYKKVAKTQISGSFLATGLIKVHN